LRSVQKRVIAKHRFVTPVAAAIHRNLCNDKAKMPRARASGSFRNTQIWIEQ
jgi:hypothetical protein